MLSVDLGFDETDYDDRWYGAGQCRYVFLHDDSNRKTDYLGSGVYSTVWTACSRRCQILHDFVDLFYVDLPCESVYLSLQGAGIWTNRGVDWNVYGLDGTWHYLYDSIPQTEMA